MQNSPAVTEKNAQTIVEDIKKDFSKKEGQLIQRAYEVAAEAHKKQKRASGEQYIVHPVDAARTLSQMNMDAQTIAAVLLHDVVDDTPVTLEEIEREFGKDVAFLVDGVSKLGKLKYRGAERHAENLRKMLVAMAKDVRVILIKLADRLHNIKTLDSLPERKQKRIALETLEIYAPTAERLGVSEIGKQLEDLAFPYVYPEAYNYIIKETNYRIQNAEKYLKRLSPTLKKELAKENIRPQKIEMRAKHNYSLWRKLEKFNYNWSQINDLIAVRIIVGSVEECYRTMGVIHNIWKPIPGRIKDYIALPKPNGYQSLHTTVFCLDGRRTEFQVRTPDMHENAEYGIAAHWRYKNKGGQPNHKLEKTYNWVAQLQEWKKDASPTDEFIENLKLDVFNNRIFVFTPNGDVIDLPQGATPVDFAYAIHSDIGNKCETAIRNGKIISLNTELNNGDVVKIITAKNKRPSQTWLNFVKTRNARHNINRCIKQRNRKENEQVGLNMVNEELKSIEGKTWESLEVNKKKGVINALGIQDENHLLISVGKGDISVNRVIKNIIGESEKSPHTKEQKKERIKQKNKKSSEVRIAGLSGIKSQTAKCCSPSYPESIVAYIATEKGAVIHKAECENILKTKPEDKIISAFWTNGEANKQVELEITTTDRVGMIQDITQVISGQNINIVSLKAAAPALKKEKAPRKDRATIEAKIEIENLQQLKNLTTRVKTIQGVADVKRKS